MKTQGLTFKSEGLGFSGGLGIYPDGSFGSIWGKMYLPFGKENYEKLGPEDKATIDAWFSQFETDMWAPYESQKPEIPGYLEKRLRMTYEAFQSVIDENDFTSKVAFRSYLATESKIQFGYGWDIFIESVKKSIFYGIGAYYDTQRLLAVALENPNMHNGDFGRNEIHPDAFAVQVGILISMQIAQCREWFHPWR